MAKNPNAATAKLRHASQWQDDYWLLLMQLYLKEPVGMKAKYSKALVSLSLELHIAPEHLHARMSQIARLDTPRIERLWQEYSRKPSRLNRAVRLLRSMAGFNHADAFYQGVEVEETFERFFLPLAEDKLLTPLMLTLVLDLYFQLTPPTMVAATPEVQELARLLRLPPQKVVDVLATYQYCDPYLNKRRTPQLPLLDACRQVWQRYANGDIRILLNDVAEYKEYFR